MKHFHHMLICSVVLMSFFTVHSGPTALADGLPVSQVAKLLASDGDLEDEFGYAVAISGDTAVIGARHNNDAGANSGAAYVFTRNFGGSDQWAEVAKLLPSDLAAVDIFGIAVSISGNTILVGSIGDDNVGPYSSSGSAYIFEENQGGPGAWGEAAKLIAADAATQDRFGEALDIDNDLIVVGHRTKPTPAREQELPIFLRATREGQMHGARLPSSQRRTLQVSHSSEIRFPYRGTSHSSVPRKPAPAESSWERPTSSPETRVAPTTGGGLARSQRLTVRPAPMPSVFRCHPRPPSGPRSPDCTFDSGTLTCDLGTMAPTDSVQITVETEVGYPEWGTVSNSASITADGTDPIQTNDSVTVDLRIGIFFDGFESGDLSAWN